MVLGWSVAAKIVPLPPTGSPRDRTPDSEKITINLGLVDLGQIDLLVGEGFYSNRTDLIRTAIRNQLSVHADVVKRTITRRTLVLGLQHFSRADLERALEAGQMLRIQVVGLARIADDVTPELARATIQSVVVLGAFHASEAVRSALADRIL
jgi:Arc/MetJ-type ribon-helix-helix transcriptional regulator